MLIFGALPSSTPGEEILVTISPFRYLVEKVSENTLSVGVLIPPSADMHTYEPTPQQAIKSSEAKIWFRMGSPQEEKLVTALRSNHPLVEIVDLSTLLPLIHESHCHHCQADVDLHYWLSPRLLQMMVKIVEKKLLELFPEREAQIRKGASDHFKELERVGHWLTAELAPVKGREIFVSHPAYAYLARDYGFRQISVEREGREPTPRELSQLVTELNRLHPRVIFSQQQYNSKSVQLIASRIGAKVMILDPHAENYLETLRTVGTAFRGAISPQTNVNDKREGLNG
ncbi:MAG: zinc ABC transporter substrate-binding protein [Chlamydiia bacterium]|nr:zinc ABC transporter substrate-binding protein [Chlamydiia bacterium]